MTTGSVTMDMELFVQNTIRTYLEVCIINALDYKRNSLCTCICSKPHHSFHYNNLFLYKKMYNVYVLII